MNSTKENTLLDLYYRKPRLLVLTIGVILVSGLAAYVVMPRMEDPQLTPRAANVTTRFPGATAERVEALVTEKIEKALEEIAEIKEVRSTSRSGVSSLQIELRDDVSRWTAPAIWSRIRDKVDDASLLMPPGATKPVFDELDIKADALIVALRWSHPNEASYTILRRLTKQLDEHLANLPGTAKTRIYGDPGEEVLVELDHAQLAALGLSLGDIAAQIQSSDAKVAAGQMRNATGDLLLEVSGEKRTLTDVAATPIRVGEDRAIVQLSDVATLRRAPLDPPSGLAIVHDQPAIAVGVLVRADTRIDLWTIQAKKLLEEFRQDLPHGIELDVLFEQNRYVGDRLENLLGNLIAGAGAVSLVILFMMGWRSAIIVTSALPLSCLMVLIALRALDVPIHQMSVTGLIVALGLLIDNAIVMVDEVSQRLQEGESRGNAVCHAVKHLSIPLLGSTLTTALAFGPIALMPGPAGEFVGTIAISVIIAVSSSLFLAMTIVPALAAMGLRYQTKASAESNSLGASPRWQFLEEGVYFAGLAHWYRSWLTRIYRGPNWGIAFGIVIPSLGFIAAGQLSEQFFPPADRDVLNLELELPVNASIDETLAITESVSAELKQDPTVQSVYWFVGESAPVFYYNLIPTRKNQSRYAQAIVQRTTALDNVAVIHRLQKRLDEKFPQTLPLVRQLEQGPPFYAPIEIRLFGPDLQKLQDLGDAVRLVLHETPQVIHTRAELSESFPKVKLEVDEAEARSVGLSPVEVARQFEWSLDGALGGSVVEATEELPIRVRVRENQRKSLDEILSFNLRRPGTPTTVDALTSNVPLLALTSIDLVPEISGIPRFNHRRMNEVQAFLPAGVLPAPVLKDFQQRLAESGFQLPPGYQLQLGGEAAKRDDAIGNLMANVGVLMVLMVATLVLSFQSFRMASIIGVVGVLSMGLGFGSLWLFGYPFGFMAIVGTMGLVGVAINDSIVVLAGIREHAAARTGDPTAILEIVGSATRHVLSTSLTTVAGFLPLIAAGGGFWPPLAVAISGGVVGATVLALVFVPSLYIRLFAVPNPEPKPTF
ncbi:MAG: efflux RND transporter permease subunit [Planctomycetaceae bacterium]|nr:efflux RND transporter permease subunit [Planctomycetaceae bacterium]